jgi:dynein heavy chain
MGEKAKQMIESGAIRGHWVMLQNCHLLTSWLKKLEAIIEGLNKSDKGFRLWLTTNPTSAFPLGIL